MTSLIMKMPAQQNKPRKRMDIRKRIIQESIEEPRDDNDVPPDRNELQTQSTQDEPERVPIRLLVRRIQSFTQTTVPHDLNRLRQHKENIVRYHNECNWTKLNLEQMNASRTVQQLKTHMQTVDELRHQVDIADQSKFLQLTKGIRCDVQRAIEEYGMFQSHLLKDSQYTDTASMEDTLDQQFDHLCSVSDQSVLIPKEEAAVQSWEELRTDLLELNELTRALQAEVKEQSRLVAELETNVDSAAENVQLGEVQLQGGGRLRTYFLPVGGAIVGGIVGGVVGGPIGALAGLKVGALTAAAAGTAGAIGGAFVGYKAKEFNDQSSDDNVTVKKDK